MCPTPSDDHLPESFFTTLYPEFAAPPSVFEPLVDTRLARLVEHWPGGVFCLDITLRCQLLNREARGWLRPEVAADAAPGLALHDLIADPLLGELLPYVAAALRGMEHSFDAAFEHPLHGPRWLRLRVQPDHELGRVAGVFIHLQDLTSQREAELRADRQQRDLQQEVARHAAQLDASEARFRLMTEGLRDAAIFFLDHQGRMADWPLSAQRLLGYPAEQIVGEPAQRFDPPEVQTDEAETVLALERATLLGQCESVGWRVRADGSRFWAHTVYTALYDETSGESRGYSCLMRDMTELKRLEDLLRQLNHELEDRVQERTRQLQEINQDLEAFSSSVSHDLRAPLRHISSFVEMLNETLGPQADPVVLKHLDTIGQAAEHMGQLIEGLLAFSRLGRAPLACRSVAMGALLQSSLNRVQHDPTLRRDDGGVQWTVPDDWPQVQGDGLLLSQVWDNLLANALKYSRPRAVADISLGWQATDANEWVFWVRDNGVGFDPRRADKLFGVFQRLHRARDFEGTGIGLALCRRIVERHGGRIWAESVPNQGSTFYFALPAA
ncbi:MAG TPA: ATP-binding protein [Macromonas sp.]|nr:ATP-binding protein [Macromonas sp.]